MCCTHADITTGCAPGCMTCRTRCRPYNRWTENDDNGLLANFQGLSHTCCLSPFPSVLPPLAGPLDVNPLSFSMPNTLLSYLERLQWVYAFFSESGLPDFPYFGPRAVQVVVLRHPIRR